MCIIEPIVLAIEDAMADRVAPIPADELGVLVADHLRRADPLAYLRYISAQRHFTHVRQFLDEARTLLPAAKRRA